MVFDTSRISTQKIREIIEELTELGVYDSKTGMVSYDNDDKVLEQNISAILDNIVQKHWLLFLGQTCAKGLSLDPLPKFVLLLCYYLSSSCINIPKMLIFVYNLIAYGK